MKYGVIDVGSNSVRLMMSDGVKTLYKSVCTTRLAEGMTDDKKLSLIAINRTADAICRFVDKAKVDGADKVYAFATAAVRQSSNSQTFLDKVKSLCDIDVEVISGEREAYLGLIGALNGANGGIIDVGGASTEVAVVQDKNTIYSKSVPHGAVKLKDDCGQDLPKVKDKVLSVISEFTDTIKTEYFTIGGTATSIAAMLQELEPYDPNKTHGYKITLGELKALTDKLYEMTIDERKKLKGLQPERAEVIAGGALILLEVMKKIGLEVITVSESDNLEGYLKQILEK